MCDKENQGMVCYDDIKPIFESMKNMEEFKHCKFNNEKKQKEIFPEDEQFSWRIFYKKLFGLERHSPKVGPQKKEILSIFDEAPELSNNHEETVEKLINNVHSYNFKRCPFYFPPD